MLRGVGHYGLGQPLRIRTPLSSLLNPPSRPAPQAASAPSPRPAPEKSQAAWGAEGASLSGSRVHSPGPAAASSPPPSGVLHDTPDQQAWDTIEPAHEALKPDGHEPAGAGGVAALVELEAQL